jgi:hypothetical protein
VDVSLMGAVILWCGATVWANPTKPNIQFLERDEAAKAYVDETEPYFSLMQRLEMTAKVGLNTRSGDLDDLRKKAQASYGRGVLAFSDAEKKTIEWYVHRCHPALEKTYPDSTSFAWSFIKVSDRIEAGLPHTRGDHIVLAPGVLSRMRLMQRQGSEATAMMIMGALMVHERMHVFQRRQRERFTRLYTAGWGFIRTDKITAPPDLTQHQILNPDGIEVGWIYPMTDAKGQKRWIWPRVLIRPTRGRPAKMPRDMELVGVEVRPEDEGFVVVTTDKGKVQARFLQAIPAYMKAFGSSRHGYHPNEASADLMTRVVAFDHFIPERLRRATESKRLAPFRKLFAEHFGPNAKPVPQAAECN